MKYDRGVKVHLYAKANVQQEAIQQLAIICSMEVTLKGQKARCQKIPRPREQSRKLLEALQIELPDVLPCQGVWVVTGKKFIHQRINQ